MRRSTASSIGDEMFDLSSVTNLDQQKNENIGGVDSRVKSKPSNAEVTVPAAKEKKRPATSAASSKTAKYPTSGRISSSTPVSSSKVMKNKPLIHKKTLIQPPMWSSKLKPAIVTKEVATSEESVFSKTQKEPTKALAGSQPPRSSLEDEFDPFLFLQKLRTQTIAFKKKKSYRKLSDLYTLAIRKFPTNPNFHCNRSFAFQKLEYYGKALDDANTAIQLNDLHKGAYHRRAAAYLGLGMVINALDDFERLMKLCPKSKKIKCKYLLCKKTLTKCIFESLLSDNCSEHQFDDLVSFETIKVENTYNGPRLPSEKLNTSFIWTLMKYYRTEGILHRKYVYKIMFQVEALLKTMPSLIDIELTGGEDNLAVCGDIQGQYFDLVYILEKNGFPSNKRRYLFNGNFIGKGSFSVEVAILLFAFKLVFPTKFFIARGHHETLAMMKVFGFEKEVMTKYSPIMFEIFTRIFQWLPLAHRVNKKILVLHGGLFSEDNVTLDDIRDLPRNMEPTETDLKLTDILWSDPQKEDGKQKNFRNMGGVMFGPDVTEAFLQQNELDYIIRSHEYKPVGYWEDHDGKCITVFSAPNYCDTYGNKGAFIILTGKDLVRSYETIEAQFHPDVPSLHYADSIYQMTI